MLDFLKKKKRRTSSAPENSPELALKIGKRIAIVVAVPIVCLLVRKAWLSGYLYAPSQFRIDDIRRQVDVSTGKMIKADMVYEMFGLSNGVNQMTVDIEKQYKRLASTPNVKDIRIERTLPDKMKVSIVEREPIARLQSSAQKGLVVDEEGVVFVRYADIGALPLIKPGESEQPKAGDRLAGMEMAAVEVVAATMEPGSRLKLDEIQCRSYDHLWLIFNDYRKASLAWPGLGDGEIGEASVRSKAIRTQLADLASAMETEQGRYRQIWDATQPGRIHALPVR